MIFQRIYIFKYCLYIKRQNLLFLMHAQKHVPETREENPLFGVHTKNAGVINNNNNNNNNNTPIRAERLIKFDLIILWTLKSIFQHIILLILRANTRYVQYF